MAPCIGPDTRRAFPHPCATFTLNVPPCLTAGSRQHCKQGITNLLVSAALFRNMDLALCLNVFGCLACVQGWHRAREERRRNRHGVTYPKVAATSQM